MNTKVAPGLPATFSKIVVHKLSNSFAEATRIETHSLRDLIASIRPDQVVVQTHFVGINASEINLTAGRYDPSVKPPFDCGFEAIGIIVAAGSNTRLALGQPVGSMNYGAFSEYIVVQERSALPIPTIDKRFLAVMVTGLTASLALEHHGRIRSGETVLVTAAAGATGQMAVQIAKQAGCHVIGTCSSESKSDFLKSIGCDHVINYKRESIEKVLKAKYPKGVDVVFESVGGETFHQALKGLGIRGRMVIIGAISTYTDVPSDSSKSNSLAATWKDSVQTATLLNRSTTVTGFFLNHYFAEVPAHFKKLTKAVLDGKIKAGVDPTSFYGLKDIPSAIALMYAGTNVGKVVVDMRQDSRTVSKL